MAITTLVFDFGNVVAFFSHRRSAEQLAAYGDADPQAIQSFLFGGALEDDFESGRLGSDALKELVCQRFRLTCTASQFALAFSDMFDANDAVCSLLPQLKSRYRLLLLSNTTELHSRHFLAQFAEHVRWFDDLILSHEIAMRKPDPRVYEHCRQLAGSQPDECVFIDDIAANVESAIACGWHGIVYQRGDDLCAELRRLGIVISPLPCTQGRGE